MLKNVLLLFFLCAANEDKDKVQMLSKLLFKIKMQVISYGVKDCIRNQGISNQ